MDGWMDQLINLNYTLKTRFFFVYEANDLSRQDFANNGCERHLDVHESTKIPNFPFSLSHPFNPHFISLSKPKIRSLPPNDPSTFDKPHFGRYYARDGGHFAIPNRVLRFYDGDDF